MEKKRHVKTLDDFYGLIDESKKTKRNIIKEYPDVSQKNIILLKSYLESLLGIMKVQGKQVLYTKEGKSTRIDISYEISELKKDIAFLEQGEKYFETYLQRMHKDLKKESQNLSRKLKKDFSCLATDRDGTINNYCARYISSVQSVYNAVFITAFIKKRVKHPIAITSAPLKGIVDMSIFPKDSIIYAGSKGREFLDGKKRITMKISPKKKAVLNRFTKELTNLLSKKENQKFMLIGSGLQEKFGQVTIARQDITGSIPKDESNTFLKKVEEIVKMTDPERTNLMIEDTGLDIEIILTSDEEERSFDKGDGINFIAKQLNIDLKTGKNLVCGDTSSDTAIAEKLLEKNKNTTIVFVTKDIKLKNKIKKLSKDALFVTNPDTLVYSLYKASG